MQPLRGLEPRNAGCSLDLFVGNAFRRQAGVSETLAQIRYLDQTSQLIEDDRGRARHPKLPPVPIPDICRSAPYNAAGTVMVALFPPPSTRGETHHPGTALEPGTSRRADGGRSSGRSWRRGTLEPDTIHKRWRITSAVGR